MTDPITILLRIVHILGGVIWVGGDLLVFFVLIPRAARFGDAAVIEILRFTVPWGRWTNVFGTLSLASGIVLALRLRWGVLDQWFITGWGWAMLVAFVAVLVFVVLGGRYERHFKDMNALVGELDGRPATPEDGDRGRDLITATLRLRPVLGLMVIAVGAMAAARFL